MSDPLCVRGFQSLGNLLRIIERRLDGQRTFESLAWDQFHHQSAFFNAVNLSDVGMVQRRQDLSLTLEARHALRIVSEGLRQHFQRNVALQFGVSGAVDLAHATRT